MCVISSGSTEGPSCAKLAIRVLSDRALVSSRRSSPAFGTQDILRHRGIVVLCRVATNRPFFEVGCDSALGKLSIGVFRLLRSWTC